MLYGITLKGAPVLLRRSFFRVLQFRAGGKEQLQHVRCIPLPRQPGGHMFLSSNEYPTIVFPLFLCCIKSIDGFLLCRLFFIVPIIIVLTTHVLNVYNSYV